MPETPTNSETEYKNFAELSKNERLDRDYKINIQWSEENPAISIIAPHGGSIEQGTSKISKAIAANKYNLYCFEGIKSAGNNKLHITSTRFDEPKCINIAAQSSIIISVHGLAGYNENVEIGGLDHALKKSIEKNLIAENFQAAISLPESHFSAQTKTNICNRSNRGCGVQLEITRGLRNSLVQDEGRLEKFAYAIQTAIENYKITIA
jgi:phage replication-related protein YjqB (UPF0714/DUF867 family)